MSLYLIWGVIAWYGGYRAKEGQSDLDDILIVFFCLIFATWGFMIVGALAPDVGGGVDAAKDIFAIIDY